MEDELSRDAIQQDQNLFVVEFKLLISIDTKVGFKSEDTGKILRLQHEYSKSLS